METSVHVAALACPAPRELPLEIVERKGLGHPDSLCDALGENLSIALSKFYLERFGTLMHHNVDKALLCGGAARPAFGAGELTQPIEIYLAGRATAEFRGVQVPVEEIAIEESRAWLRQHLRCLDPERHVRIIPRIRPTSSDLAVLFQRQQATGRALANDTSLGVGFAPLDELERTVLAVEKRLNCKQTKEQHPQIGADIKVMGVRRGNEIELTVACAIVGRYVANLEDYFASKARIGDLALGAARGVTRVPVAVRVNTGDGETPDSIYLTVTGLSAEAGDDGQLGRGNRANGLITPYRPMSIEAVAGKNPVTHVGKLYNVVANRVAQAVIDGVSGVEEVYCYLLSRIGDPITEPQVFEVKARLTEPDGLAVLEPRIATVARGELERIDSVWREALDGRLQVC